MSEYQKGFNDAMGKCDEQIEKLFFELKEMKDELDKHDWKMAELNGAMLALSMLKRTLVELFLMRVESA